MNRSPSTMKSLRWRVLGSSVVAAAVTSIAVAVATEFMILETDDRNVLLGVIAGAFVVAVIVAVRLSQPLIGDLERMADAASRVADGDFTARTGVRRADELGTTAAAFDDMVAELAAADARRVADEEERRLLFASISHDLRTPLAAIRAAIEAIEDGVGDRDRLLSAAQRDVVALGGLVDDLFLMAQLDAGRYEPQAEVIDMAEVVDDAVETLLPTAAAAGVDLQVATTGVRRVVGSHKELARVVRNLLDNAIRHTPPSTVVSVEVSRGPDGSVCVRVVDEGPGFPPDLVDVAHQPFTRGDAARGRGTGGAGLGLAIANGVVEAHGGRLIVAPGPGGHVRIELPAAV